MIVRPVLLCERVKQELARSMETSEWTWPQIEEWIATKTACVWQIGCMAWAITAVNEDEEVDVIVAGGRGANRASAPFLRAIEALPEHKGLTLRIEGRRGWKRYAKNWDCEEVGGGDVILTKRV